MAEIVTDRTPAYEDWRRSYDAHMAEAEARYRDVIDHLRGAEIAATMEQMGGMCLAIMWPAPGGEYFLLTDAEDGLSFDRDPYQGWGLGLYDDDGPLWPDLITCGYKTPRTALAMAIEGIQRLQREAQT